MHVISIISLYTSAINAENFLAFLPLVVPNITLGVDGLISSILALFSRVVKVTIPNKSQNLKLQNPIDPHIA